MRCRTRSHTPNPAGSQRQLAEFAQKEVAERVVAILIEGEAGRAGAFAEFGFVGHVVDAIKHAEQVFDLFFAAALVRAGHGEERGVPCDLGTGGHVVVTDELAACSDCP